MQKWINSGNLSFFCKTNVEYRLFKVLLKSLFFISYFPDFVFSAHRHFEQKSPSWGERMLFFTKSSLKFMLFNIFFIWFIDWKRTGITRFFFLYRWVTRLVSSGNVTRRVRSRDQSHKIPLQHPTFYTFINNSYHKPSLQSIQFQFNTMFVFAPVAII